MVKILSVFNNKGGVGKTTIVNIIKDTCKYNKILLIDLDPQMNLTSDIIDNFKDYLKNLDTNNNIKHKLTELMSIGRFEVDPVIKSDKIHLIPGHPDLSLIMKFMDTELFGNGPLNYSKSIQYLIGEYDKIYDYDLVIIDLAPDLYTLNQMALLSSNYLLIPCTVDYYCCVSFKMVYEKIFSNNSYYKRMNSNLKIIGFVTNMVNFINDKTISDEDNAKIDELEENFKEYLFDYTVINDYSPVILGKYSSISKEEMLEQRKDLIKFIRNKMI